MHTKNIKEQKSDLRKEIKDIFASKTVKNLNKLSEQITNKLFKLPIWQNAKIIFCYISMQKEVDTSLIIKKCFEENKKIFVPSLKDELNFYEHQRNSKNIEIDLPSIKPDIIICPGLAFDRNNNRLGRGKGFYDKYLETINSKAIKIGLCFDFQLLSYIPTEDHDQKMNIVISN